MTRSLKHCGLPSSTMGRAFGPSQTVFGPLPWGVAPGWYSGGPLALKQIYSTHQPGPKARPHTGPGQRPGENVRPAKRAEGPTPYQTGATPRGKTSTLPKGPKARPISSFHIKLTQSREIFSPFSTNSAQIESQESYKHPADHPATRS
jgi:hypothetical protein